MGNDSSSLQRWLIILTTFPSEYHELLGDLVYNDVIWKWRVRDSI